MKKQKKIEKLKKIMAEAAAAAVAEKVAEEIGVQNSLRFSANAEETDAMFAKERKSRSKFYSKMSMCLAEEEPCASMVESNDYFADDEPETTQAPEPKKGGLMDRLFGKK